MKKTTLLLLLFAAFANAQFGFEQFATYTGSNAGAPNYLTQFNNELYFSASSLPSTSNTELWKTNGTQAGLNQAADINLGLPGSDPYDFFEFNGYLYFTAFTGATGRELYRTNSTTTTLFKDFRTGINDGFDVGTNAHQFVILNNKMYFFAREDANGYDLWRTDGTVTGTQKMVELNSNSLGVRDYFLEVNGELFFIMNLNMQNTIGNELYKYNEVQNAVTLVKDINPNNQNSGSFHIAYMTKFDNKLFFSAINANAQKLYVSDGTNDGTFVVENEIPLNYFDPTKLYVFNNELYFIANKTGLGRDLYKCIKNTEDDYEPQFEYVIELVYNFNAGGNSNLFPFGSLSVTSPPLFVELNNELYFAAREQSAPNNGNNYQIYKTNGITTQIAFAINETVVGPANDPIRQPSVFNGKIFFLMKGLGMPQEQLWVANPTDASVTRLTNYFGSNLQPQAVREVKPIIYNNALYFRGNTNNEGDELWKLSDGLLSSNQINSTKTILVYPNPTSGILNLQNPHTSEFQIEIFDIIGKKVGQFKNQNRLDISNYNSGMYLIKITDLQFNKTTTQKVIKQ
jgi:ELWxxDGT repeat protein